MTCVGISHVKLKTGEPRVIINALSRRSGTQGFDSQKIWITEEEFARCGICLGLQFRAFSDGGIFIIEGIPIALDALELMV